MDRRASKGSTLIVVLWAVSLLAMLSLSAGYYAGVEGKLAGRRIDRLKERRLCLAAAELMKRPDLSRSQTLADGTVSIGEIEAEEEKVDLNRARLKELEAVPGMTPAAAAAIVDWRDADSDESPGGAEESYYQSLAVPYRCKNAALGSLEELLMVRHVTPEVYAAIRPFVTVYGSGHIRASAAITGPRSRSARYEIILKLGPGEHEGSIVNLVRL